MRQAEDPGRLDFDGISVIYDWYRQKEAGLDLSRQMILRDILSSESEIKNRQEIRTMFPDAYPSIEFEALIMKSVKKEVRRILSERNFLDEQGMLIKFADYQAGARLGRLVFLCNEFSISYLLWMLATMGSIIDHDDSENNRLITDDMLNLVDAQRSPPRSPFLKLAVWVIEQYHNAGFTWRYFMFYNEKSPVTQVSQGRVPLTPDVFEVGAAQFQIRDYPHHYEVLMRRFRDQRENDEELRTIYRYDPSIVYSSSLDKSRDQNGNLIHRVGLRAAPFTTWTKKDIVKAIIDTGLVVEITDPNRGPQRGLKTRGLLRSTIKERDRETPGRHKKYVPIGLQYRRDGIPQYYDDNTFKYIILYRRLFNTMSYIDWPKAFQLGIINQSQLPMVAREFGLDPGLDEQTIRRRIAEISEKRLDLTRQIAELVPGQSQAVIYQPSSRWLKPITRYQFAGGDTIQLTKPYEQFVAVKAMCEDDSIDKEQFLRRIELAGMNYLLNIDTTEMSKADICDYLVEHINYQADKYERLFFDCSDPDISIQSILNSLKTMELEGIVKDVDLTSITKDDLCRIINNYLDILLEAKALRIAKNEV